MSLSCTSGIFGSITQADQDRNKYLKFFFSKNCDIIKKKETRKKNTFHDENCRRSNLCIFQTKNFSSKTARKIDTLEKFDEYIQSL